MTQAYNLAILANAVDTSGRLNVATNSTGVLPVANGGTGSSSTPTNGQIPIGNGTNYTPATLTAGTNIAITNGAGTITISNTSTASGTVTSVATGNGLQGGTITTSGTLSVACPSYNTVGSYITGGGYFTTINAPGTTHSAGYGTNQIMPMAVQEDGGNFMFRYGSTFGYTVSGTWRVMTLTGNANCMMLCCRVS
jgi:hypothetical protein